MHLSDGLAKIGFAVVAAVAAGVLLVFLAERREKRIAGSVAGGTIVTPTGLLVYGVETAVFIALFLAPALWPHSLLGRAMTPWWAKAVAFVAVWAVSIPIESALARKGRPCVRHPRAEAANDVDAST